MIKFKCCTKSHIILCENCNKFSCINCDYILNNDDFYNLNNLDYQIIITVSCIICDKNE